MKIDLLEELKTLSMIVVGAILVLAWEHATPWGLGHKLKAESAKYDVAHDANTLCVAQTKGWSAAYNAEGSLMAQHVQSASSALSAASTRCEMSGSRSFDAGIALGRNLERQANAPSAPSDPARPSAGLVPVDIGTAWNGTGASSAP